MPISEDYEIDLSKVLGVGYSGPVTVAQHKRTGRKCAVKTFHKRAMDKKRFGYLQAEVNIYIKLDHPHIARLLDVYEDEHTVSLVMEMCTGKELYHRLAKRKIFRESDAAETTHQMLLAISYLHSHQVVHRDLKLENWLYESEAQDAHLKLIDFGFSKLWERNTRMHQSCGSITYVAPEVLKKDYTNACDIWSLGVIVFMLLAGHPPFHDPDQDILVDLILRGNCYFHEKQWRNVTETAKDFVKSLLRVQPDRRPNAETALAHPWISRQRRPSIAEIQANEPLSPSILEGMRQHAMSSHLKRAVLLMVAYSLSSEDIAGLNATFLALDKNKHGTVTLSEFRRALESFNDIPNVEVERLFDSLDHAHSGEITYTDFVAAMLQTRVRLHEDLIHEAFSRLDQSNSERITAEDLRKVLGEEAFAEEDLGKLLAECDPSGSGSLSYEDFLRLLQSEQAYEEDKEGVDASPRKQATRRLAKMANAVVDTELVRMELDEDGKEPSSPRIRRVLSNSWQKKLLQRQLSPKLGDLECLTACNVETPPVSKLSSPVVSRIGSPRRSISMNSGNLPDLPELKLVDQAVSSPKDEVGRRNMISL